MPIPTPPPTPAVTARADEPPPKGPAVPPSPRRRMAKCVLVTALMLPAATLLAQSSQPDISLEYAVKATYLYKLAPFVDWPPRTFASVDAPFRICVLGPDPFDDYLEKAIRGRKLGTHPFEVRQLAAAARGDDCQIVFIGSMPVAQVRAALRAFSGKPVLTVTDSNDPDSSGSVVQFVIDAGHVRFDIDNAAAVQNHLVISSKLLSLARKVTGTS